MISNRRCVCAINTRSPAAAAGTDADGAGGSDSQSASSSSEVIIIKLPVFESVNFRFVLWRLLGKRNCRVDDSNDYYKTPRFRFVSYF